MPRFQQVQREFAAHIRHPLRNSAPPDVDPRRMQVYVDLFYRNIESFLSNCFITAHEILGDENWHAVVRDFIHRHRSESPFFLDIAQEFLEFISTEREGMDDPPFLTELCHFEWVKQDLRYRPEELPARESDVELSDATIQISPLARPLSYEWPVHEIGSEFQPNDKPVERTWLVLYRDRAYGVHMITASMGTHRLLALLGEPTTFSSVVDIVCSEMESGKGRAEEAVTNAIHDLEQRDVVLVSTVAESRA